MWNSMHTLTGELKDTYETATESLTSLSFSYTLPMWTHTSRHTYTGPSSARSEGLLIMSHATVLETQTWAAAGLFYWRECFKTMGEKTEAAFWECNDNELLSLIQGSNPHSMTLWSLCKELKTHTHVVCLEEKHTYANTWYWTNTFIS